MIQPCLPRLAPAEHCVNRPLSRLVQPSRITFTLSISLADVRNQRKLTVYRYN
uniref:Uncharacterized protein n=1 Tax=Anguilla anguilla TaxID=7936 RepID=A0A0E9VKE6_ANGAN